jgi:hypothetical protein
VPSNGDGTPLTFTPGITIPANTTIYTFGPRTVSVIGYDVAA